MNRIRIIARLDIKSENLIKGIHLEGLRVLGKPNEFARNYYKQGVDELLYMDAVASLYGRNNLFQIVQKTAQNIFIPLTAGGGVRSLQDAENLLRSGADKVALNTGAHKNPRLISQIAEIFGSQCVILSVEAKKVSPDRWEAYTDNGREKTNKDVLTWVQKAQELGVGEILLTSIDREGTGKGFDLELIKSVRQVTRVPMIISGGAGNIEHIEEALHHTNVQAVALANILHYKKNDIPSIKHQLNEKQYPVRMTP